jgi:excisionase family DNA binding protein
MSSEPTRAIYVRMPDRLARRLDRAAQRLGTSKREVMASLVNDHLNLDADNFVLRVRSGADLGEGEEARASEVMTVEETAALLRVEVGEIQTLIADRVLPARQLGTNWRLSRSAVLAWLRNGGGTTETSP